MCNPALGCLYSEGDTNGVMVRRLQCHHRVIKLERSRDLRVIFSEEVPPICSPLRRSCPYYPSDKRSAALPVTSLSCTLTKWMSLLRLPSWYSELYSHQCLIVPKVLSSLLDDWRSAHIGQRQWNCKEHWLCSGPTVVDCTAGAATRRSTAS